MADDIQSNIRIDIDATSALATLKNLQRQISAFHTSMIKGSADAAAASALYQQKLVNAINRTGQFSAEITKVASSSESFTTALEKNKLSMGEYFRYAGGASKSFGKMFKAEFRTIEKTAIERVKTLQTQYIQLGRDANGALKAIKIKPLALDMKDLSVQTQIAAQKTQILNKLMMQGSTNLLNFGKNTQWAGRQLMVGFTVPLTMLGSIASKTFMEMEEQAIKFKRVYGETFTTSAETDKMLQQIKSLANEFTKYGIAVSDTMAMAADAAAQGKMGADLLAQVSQATKLATLGNVEQQQALETTISITNAFGIATEDLAGKIDFLNAVENQTVTSIEDLTVAIPKAGPVIKQLGGSVEDLAFFLTAMKEGGINASEGANALKSGLAAMINPTRQASEFMAKFGISISGIVEGNKGDVKGMVMGLAQALDKLDPLNRARAIEQMFGKFQFARISTLLQNVTKDSSQATRVLGLTKASAAELAVLSQRELSKMEASPMYKFQKAVEDLKTSLVPLGEAFIKAITPVVNFAKGILDRFNALDEGAKSFVTGLVGVVGVIGPAFLMGFGLIANGVANVIKLFTNMKMAYNRALDSTGELGVQTDYMTQAELEAQAAAASLDQAHSTLTQTFNVEAAALANLTTAYEKAIAAQNVFSGSNPGMFPGGAPGSSVPDGTGKRRGQWKGYAEGGIIRGPGTGTSDSIVAMVSDGEAIIPADKTKKYGPLINGIISGNIPGFSQGLGAKGLTDSDQTFMTDFSGKAGKSIATWLENELKKVRSRGFVEDPEKTAAALKEFATNLVEVNKEMRSGAQAKKAYKESPEGQAINQQYSRNADSENRVVFAHGAAGKTVSAMQGVGMFEGRFGQNVENLATVDPNAKLNLRGGFGVDIPQYINNLLTVRQGSGGAKLDDLKSYVSGAAGSSIFGTTIGIGGGNATELGSEAEAVKNEFSRLLQQSLNDGKTMIVDSETDIAAIRKKQGEEVAKQYASLETILQQARANTRQTAPAINGVFDVAENTITEGRGPEKSGGRGWMDKVYQKLFGRAGYEKNMGGNTIAYRKKGGAGATLDQFTDESGEGPILRDPTAAEKEGQIDATAYQKGRDAVLAKKDSMPITRDRNSPHPLAPKDGKDDATAYLQSRNEILNAKDIYPSQPIPGVTPPGAPGSSKLPTPPTLGSIPGVEAPKAVESKKPGLVAKLAAKGAEAAGNGIDALKDKVNQVGQNLVDKWNAKIDEEAAASVRLGNQRMDIADQILMATDAEYAALDAQRKMLIQKAQSGQQLSQEEMNIYTQANEILSQKANVLADEMQQTGLEGENIKQRLTNAEQKGIVISEEQRNAIQDSAGKTPPPTGGEGAKGKSILKNLSKASMVLSTVSMGVSMIPGEIGKQAQQLMGPLMAMSAVLPMLSSKMGAATVAVGALVGAFMWLKGSMDEARTKGYEMAEALGAGEKNIKKLAEFAGKASAGETASKMREDKFGQFEIKNGKKTFGESFVESDAGKEMLTAVKDVVSKGGGREMAKNQLLGQLTTGVASGALSAAQARSIAANIGEELGDMSFGIQINAKMISLLGPNGENLAKDPVGIRVAILEQSRKDMGTQIAAMNSQQVNPGGAILGGIGGGLAGAGVGVASGLAIAAGAAATGATVGSAVPVVGTIIGAVTGLIAGAVVGSIEENKRIAQQAGSLVAMQQMALQQQQEMVDSLDLDYQKRIEIARQAGNLEEAERLTNDHIIARGKLFDEQGKLMGQITDSYVNAGTGFLGGEWFSERAAMNQAADDAIRAKYKEGPMASIAESAISGVKGAAISDEADYTLRVAMSTGDIDPMAMLIFTNTYGQDEAMMNKTVSVMTKFGTVFLGEAMQAMNLFVNPDGSPIKEQQTAFMMKIDSMTSAEAQEYVDLLANVAKTGSVVPMGISTTFYQNNPEAAAEIQTTIADLEKVKDEDFNIDAAVKVIGQDDMATLLSDAEYFNKLPKKQRKVYVQVMDTLLNLEGDPAMMTLFNNWVKEKGNENLTFKDYVKFLTQQVTETTDTTKGTETPTPTGGGGGPTASPIDDYLKKLRDLRNELVKVPVGFAASMKEINKWFGGNKTIKVYDGLKNQMRGLGLDEGLIETLIGMDPAEFEKQKKKLFTLDARGMIKGLTSAGKELREAADAVAMGTWNDSMESQTKLTQDQQKAFSRLTTAGMSVADAYETIQDAALAQALASKNVTDADIAGRVKLNNEMRAGLRLMAAMTALEKRNSEVKDTTRLLRGLNKPNSFGFKEEDMQKILADDVMREAYTAMIQPNVKPEDAKRLQKVIEDALKMANVTAANDLILKYKSGLVGLEQIFNEGFDKAMESFSVRERKLQLQADVDMKPFNDVIEAAQDSIAAIEYQIDDYDAGLKRIADKEELINKAYDDKLEALDKVQQANDVIARQQKNQLSLADALASGDIAAAARAAQEIRQQDAQDAIDRQRDTLEKARKSELESQTSMVTVGGKQVSMTRKQIEDAKKILEDKVFNIQETDLEPAQEQIRQIQARLREDIQAITVDGKTKTQWEQLGNSVDYARVTSEKFTDAMKNATTVVQDLISAWGKEKGMTIAEAQEIVNGTSLTEVAGEYVAPVKETQTNVTNPSSGGGGNGGNGQQDDGKPDIVPEVPEVPDVPVATGMKANEFQLSMLSDKNQLIARENFRNKLTRVKAKLKTDLADAGINISDVMNRDSVSLEKLGTYNKIRSASGVDALQRTVDRYNFNEIFGSIDDSAQAKANRADYVATLPKEIQDALKLLKGRRGSYSALSGSYLSSKSTLSSKLGLDSQLTKFATDSNGMFVGKKMMEAIGIIKANKPEFYSKHKTAIDGFEKIYKEFNQKKMDIDKARKLLLDNGYTESNLLWYFNDDKGWATTNSSGKYATSPYSYAYDPDRITGFANGGMVLPKKFVEGGYASGTDTVPAMLTPGEFVVRKFAVDSFGADRLEAINSGIDPTAGGNSNTSIIGGDSLYNYNVNVNVRSDADPSAIARTVMEQLRRVDSQRIRSTRV